MLYRMMIYRVKAALGTVTQVFSVLPLFGWLSMAFCVVFVVSALTYGGLTWLDDRWRPFAAFPVAVDATLFALMSVLLLGGQVSVRQELRERQATQQRLAQVSPVVRTLIAAVPFNAMILLLARLVLLAGVIVTFSGLCRHWSLTYGGFTSRSADYLSWLWYGVTWLLDNYSLNLTQVFDWQISTIHATALGARLLVFAYNVVIDVAAIRGIVALGSAIANEFALFDSEATGQQRDMDPLERTIGDL